MLARDYLDPYIIAEIGVNHEGSLERAKAMIWAASRGGAHAAKFQSYKAGTLASPAMSPAYWDTTKEPTTSQYELFQKYDSFGPTEYCELALECKEAGIDFMSTPFDLESVDMLDPLVTAFKVASADLTNVPLLRKVASKHRPVILSVGAATLNEIGWALDVLAAAGAAEVALLHCVLRYPTPPHLANLSAIRTLGREFGDRVLIGYSDHVPPTATGTAPAIEMAAILGARVIEKHFTDDREGAGNDHYHAFDEPGLAQFVSRLSEFRQLSGDGLLHVEHQNAAVVNARRRVFAARSLAEGQIIREEDLIALRANQGIEVIEWDNIVGRKMTVAKCTGEPLLHGDLA